MPARARLAEYFIPAGILLKCFLEVSDKEIYEKLVASASTVSRCGTWHKRHE